MHVKRTSLLLQSRRLRWHCEDFCGQKVFMLLIVATTISADGPLYIGSYPDFTFTLPLMSRIERKYCLMSTSCLTVLFGIFHI